MIVPLKGKAFNGQEVKIQVDISLNGRPEINREPVRSVLLSENTHAKVQQLLLDILKQTYPDFEINSVAFDIVSRDLQSMLKIRIIPDAEELATGLYALVIESIAASLGILSKGDITHFIDQLVEKKADFATYFLGDTPHRLDDMVARAIELFSERKYSETERLLTEMDRGSLSSEDIQTLDHLQFQLTLKKSDCGSEDAETLFRNCLKDVQDYPQQTKQYYFSFIKFLEDCRDGYGPRKLLREFKKKHPLSILQSNEKAFYYFLNGRAEYARGEFLGALELLKLAMVHVDASNKKLTASIQNTSANCFADNLFFDEAKKIAQDALEIRKLLNLPERYETVGCLAGIAFKRGDFKRAYALFQEYELLAREVALSDAEKNRLFNYLAKSAIMCGNLDEANGWLNNAFEAGDRLGFSAMINLLLLLKRQNYEEMESSFLASCFLPENHRDYDSFALGWGYVFMACASFDKGNFGDGVKLLARAVDFFQNDLYVVEAAYSILYLYVYQIPSEYVDLFTDIQPPDPVLRQFEKYVGKHAAIPQKYFGIFHIGDLPQGGEAMLQMLFNRVKDIDDTNYNPEDVQDILDLVCLY